MKVYLHIGAGKTGTSAIQVALAQNRASLAASGLCYPDLPPGMEDRAVRGEISSGNARALGWFCNPNAPIRNITRESVQQWIAGCIAEARGRNLLFSSEALQSARPEEACELLGIFQQAGYAVEVIFYARHLLDHAIAEYLQHVKMGFSTLPARDQVDSLGDFLRHYRCRFLRSIRPFAELLPRESVHVRLYDAERRTLLPNFFALLGVAAPPAALAGGTRVINRSPSPDEVPLFEAMARQPDGVRLCKTLTDLLLNSPAPDERPFMVTEAEFAEFSARNQAAVKQMNEVWLTGPDKLQLKSDRILLGEPPAPSVQEATAQFTAMMAAVLRGMQAARGRPRPGQRPLDRPRG